MIELRERGSDRDGQPQLSDRRLFLQLVALDCANTKKARKAARHLAECPEMDQLGAVIYGDMHRPTTIALLTWSERPEDLFECLCRALATSPLVSGCRIRNRLGMLGRTYSTGFETDLEDWLIDRPVRTLLSDSAHFGIWYPLQRKKGFERLGAREKAEVLMEHGRIGRAYGEQGLVHDIRLVCHGLDTNDNDFVIGLIGESLHPLSHVVQQMRGTRQTSEYIERMGPFFVGRNLYRRPPRR